MIYKRTFKTPEYTTDICFIGTKKQVLAREAMVGLKNSHICKISPKVVKSRYIARNAEEDEEEGKGS